MESKDRQDASDRRFGPYTVLERIGVGGMATVHLATEIGKDANERVVALKRLLPHLANDDEFIKSFVQEAQLASLLKHDNIAQVYELGRVGECYFIAMEYVHGLDLRSCLKKSQKVAGPPPLEFTIFILKQLCEALSYAHTQVDENGRPLGLVHRDISPSNLLLAADGDLKIIDFGIAKATAAHEATRSGAIKGKLSYLPPETLTGALDARADLFSAGVIAHELLTAVPLFADKNDFKVLNNIQHLEPIAPSKINPNCPVALDTVVLRALAKDPDERWQSAQEFYDAICRVENDEGIESSAAHVTHWIEYAMSLKAPEETDSFETLGSEERRYTTGELLAAIPGKQAQGPHESLLPKQSSLADYSMPLDDEPPTEIEFSLSSLEDSSAGLQSEDITLPSFDSDLKDELGSSSIHDLATISGTIGTVPRKDPAVKDFESASSKNAWPSRQGGLVERGDPTQRDSLSASETFARPSTQGGLVERGDFDENTLERLMKALPSTQAQDASSPLTTFERKRRDYSNKSLAQGTSVVNSARSLPTFSRKNLLALAGLAVMGAAVGALIYFIFG